MKGLLQIHRILGLLTNNSVVGKRFCSTVVEENVRVRFAPSPTGFVHLGGLRTALYNHLFAKSKNGTTILRIEDTDRTRIVPGATENIIEDLKWCGIYYDEGPYFQSERRDLYKQHAQMLVDSGEAYYCFCSQARLDLLRKELIKNQEVVKYDNKCRFLTKEEVAQKLSNNESYCIRFKLSDAVVGFDDLIYGNYKCNLSEQEGDPIILKSDGYPTYHLANVVDDHMMNISHVLRGTEWLVSTIKHLLMFKAFNWRPPQYGHLPLLLNSDGTKFSKRQNDLRVSYFRETGIFPNTIVNLVTRAGGGFDLDYWERDNRNFSMEELAKMFDLSKVHRNSCKLPIERLEDSNRLEIKRMMKTENDTKTLVQQIQNCIKTHFSKSNPNLKLHVEDDYVLKVLNMTVDRICRIEDLLSKDFIFMWVVPNTKFRDGESFTSKKLNDLTSQLPQINWSKESLNAYLKEFAKSQNIVYKELMGTLRVLLTNYKDGPGVAEILMLLGKENSITRLKMSLGK